ncbi:hypothetical protein [Bradyrhizobium ivorense]|uniref:hypothetical protein n=1 Tax=Bradyrhizobium ivorense TaxID=2511166 RepID=UPI0010B72A1C|nr:hypothetical protein [Bradyrhizobium ivorense]VIO80843.1 hypothetical protein CI41S_75520 [Bradyrhizobium ivorense]
MTHFDITLHLSSSGLSPDLISHTRDQLISELNEGGPIAAAVATDGPQGNKGGEIELLGQIGLALLSAGTVKYIAQVVVEFVKRHDRYEVKVGDIKISKDHASNEDMEAIHNELNKILALRKASKKSR